MLQSRRYPAVLVLLLSVAVSPRALADTTPLTTPLEKAQDYLAQDNANAAYQALQASELSNSGQPDFDYWLGVAALRAGHPSHALIALDRVIIHQPNHAGARLERLAALIQLDQRLAAESEIARLNALSPPPEAQAAIERFQAVLDQRQRSETEPQHRWQLGVDIGYDSNPQRFPNEITIDPLQPAIREALDALIEMGLTPQLAPGQDLTDFDERVFSREASAYQQLQGGYQGTYPVNETSRWLLNATGQAQRYQDDAAQDFDLSLLNAQLGYQQDIEAQRSVTYRASLLQAWSGQPQDHLLTRWGGEVAYRHPASSNSTLDWQLGIEDNAFDTSRNDYVSGRLGLQLTTRHASVHTRINAQLGHEWADTQRNGGDLLYARAGAGMDYPIGDRQLLRADLSYQQRRYQQDGFSLYNDYVAVERHDQLWQARLMWLYQLNPDWLVEARADIERRNSNVNFFDTHRLQTQLGLRYLF
ncbi:outer membrane beta-barrel protein [Halomonas sp. LS-001]